MALMTRVIIAIVLDMMIVAGVLCVWKEVGCLAHDSVIARQVWNIKLSSVDEDATHI